eukprot:TRINITY_DN36751_c0_g1_i1.p1 TRINITY_DN36751_c0_g1~~TRINITY_DN36751_c0_g1_i1.p1  ORF type:complete len:665 (+),score=144.61 TRINITY_DN36751_c0_g1_i1:36-2030(+)
MTQEVSLPLTALRSGFRYGNRALRLWLYLFAPKVFFRQLTALAALIFLRRVFWIGRRVLRTWKRSMLGAVQDKAAEKESLRRKRRKCTTYEDFQRLGEELDKAEGKDSWKRQDESPYFDAERLRERTKKYKELMAKGDVDACMYALRGELLRKHFGICNPALFEVCNTGTKLVVEQYVATVCEAMTWVGFSYRTPGQQLGEAQKAAITERLAFFNETRHGFGKSALLLSGGASVGMYHFGVVKALHLKGLLPRVINGTSAGSIVCGVVGTRTDSELMQMWKEDFSWEDNFDLDFFGDVDFIRFLKRGGEALYSSDHLGKCLRQNMGDLTFLEAFDRTGRIINITVSGLPGNTRYPMLLNYLTSPHVIVWSAAQCSAAVPGIFESRELLAKNQHGDTVPYVAGGLKWRDGSMQNDLPMARLSELFNVNYFIVSQTNPQAPLLTGGGVGSRKGPIYRTAQFLRREVKQYLLSMSDFWMGTAGRHPWLRPVGNSLVGFVVQEYEGDVTIYNGKGMMELPNLLTNGSNEMLRAYTSTSEWETWWHIPEIQNACAIEFVMDEIVKELVAELRTSEEKSKIAKRPSLIGRMMPHERGLKRLPSFHQELLQKELLGKGMQTSSPPTSLSEWHSQLQQDRKDKENVVGLRASKSRLSVSSTHNLADILLSDS